MNGNETRSFHISVKNGAYVAYALNESRGTYTPREVAYGLEDLLAKCKDAGFNHLEALSQEAINELRDYWGWWREVQWICDFVEDLWKDEATKSRKLGFKLPHERD